MDALQTEQLRIRAARCVETQFQVNVPTQEVWTEYARTKRRLLYVPHAHPRLQHKRQICVKETGLERPGDIYQEGHHTCLAALCTAKKLCCVKYNARSKMRCTCRGSLNRLLGRALNR
eukprot:350266-Chlamydomonas_euryale.AAC.12